MAINSNRAYLRALQLYESRTGIKPVDSTKNIIQDIVLAVLEEVFNHAQVQTSATFTLITTTTGGGTSNSTVKVSPGVTLEQT